MMVDICCPTCHATRTTVQPSGGAWFLCAECGTAVHFSRPPQPMAPDDAADTQTPLMPPYGEDPLAERDMTELLRSPLWSLMPTVIDCQQPALEQPSLAAPLLTRRAHRSHALLLSSAAVLAAAFTIGAAHAARGVGALHFPSTASLPVLGRVSTDVRSAVAAADLPRPAEAAAWAAAPFAVSLPSDALPPERSHDEVPAAAAMPPSTPTTPIRAVVRKPQPEPKAIDAAAAPAPAEFDRDAAVEALADISARLGECADPVVGPISTRAFVSFAPSGHATSVNVVPVPAIVGSPMVLCIVRRLRHAAVPAFDGDPVTVHMTICVK